MTRSVDGPAAAGDRRPLDPLTDERPRESDGGSIGVVVVNYASARLVERNLGSIDLAGLPVRVVLVDNWSSPEERTAAAVMAADRGWEFVAMPDNRGFAAAVNAGLAVARSVGCDCFLLLNPDAFVLPEVVVELRAHSLSEPMSLISPRITTSDGTVYFSGASLFLDSGRIRSWSPGAPPGHGQVLRGAAEPWVSGACLALNDRLLRTIGGLDESYFMYWEDLDLSHRCLLAGGRLVVREDLGAVHDAGGTQGPTRDGAKSALYYRYNCRNRLVFASRHLSRRRLLRWVRATPRVSWEILMRGGRRQLLRRPGVLLAAARGTAAGLGHAAVALAAGRHPRAGHPGATVPIGLGRR